MITNEQKLALEAQLAEVTKPQEPVACKVALLSLWQIEVSEGDAEYLEPYAKWQFADVAYGKGMLQLNDELSKRPPSDIHHKSRYIVEWLYATPQPCQRCADRDSSPQPLWPDDDPMVVAMAERIAELEAELLSNEGMVSVTKEDANNYCRILTLLGMEEEGSPVEGVERLISLRDGMTCGDCNDTGWLENREEGRYPCTCMTEAEPYQILEAKCAELEADRLIQIDLKTQFMRELNTSGEQVKELEAERDALAAVIQQLRDGITTCIAYKAAPSSELLKTGYDTSEIIKRHDAAVLRKAADTTLSEQSVLLDGMHGYTALKIQGLMIESLHLKADELEKS